MAWLDELSGLDKIINNLSFSFVSAQDLDQYNKFPKHNTVPVFHIQRWICTYLSKAENTLA